MPNDAQNRTAAIAAATARQGASISSPAWWQTNNVGPLNVRAAGAKGDGVTDDTAAIQAVLDYAGSVAFELRNTTSVGPGYAFGAAKVRVLIPEGLYLITETLTVPPGVTVHGDGVINATIADLWAFALIFSSGADVSLLKVNSFNQGCGVQFGDVGIQNDCKIGQVRLWNIGNVYDGVKGPQRGLVFQGYDYSFASLEVDGGNIGIDFNQCSDVRGDRVISVLASTGVRITSGTEHLSVNQIDIDTPQNIGLQIDSSNDLRLSASIFINDNNNTAAIATAVIIGEYSSAAAPVSYANLSLRVANTGGTALSLAYVRDSLIDLVASNAPLNTGNNFPITQGLVYGAAIDRSVIVKAAIDPSIATPTSGMPFGTLHATEQGGVVVAGTTAGSMTLYQYYEGPLLKTVCFFNGYENAAAGNVVTDFPIPYKVNALQTGSGGAPPPGAGLAVGSITFDPAAATVYNGIVVVEGI